MKQHPYQQGQESLKSCSSLFRPMWPAVRALTIIIQAATACQVAGEQVSRHSHAWVTVKRITLLIMTPSAFSVAEAVCVNVNSDIASLICIHQVMHHAIASKVIPLKLLHVSEYGSNTFMSVIPDVDQHSLCCSCWEFTERSSCCYRHQL